jgi:hypothetical protein
LNISFQALDLAEFIESTPEERLSTWDFVMPQGDGSRTDIGGVTITRNIRSVRVDESSVLVSGRSARVGSRGVEREGLPSDVIAKVTHEYKRDNPGKSVPDRLYRDVRERPLVLVHVIQAREEVEDQHPAEHLIALGLSFPRFNDSEVAKRVRYRVNLVEWKAIMENESDDDIEEVNDDES